MRASCRRKCSESRVGVGCRDPGAALVERLRPGAHLNAAMTPRNPRPRRGLLVAALSLAACSRAPVSAPHPADPVDLSGLARRTRYSFRAAARGWETTHPTYAVRVGGDGVAVAPIDPGAGGARGRQATFRTEAVGALALGDARGVVEPDGTLALDRGGVVERLRNDDDGVAQSWTFARRPAPGDLVVRVRVDGQRYAGLTAAGHHFADPSTGLGLVYGPATWVDAAGRRTSVPARWTGEAVEIAVPSSVVAGSAYPAVLDPVIGPESAVDARVRLRFEPTIRSPATAAFNGSVALIAWADSRPGRASEVYGTRVDASGALLDPGGFPIAPLALDRTAPTVTSNGADFLVLWSGQAARVSADGAVRSVGASPVGGNSATSNPYGIGVSASAVADGAGYVAAWGDGSVRVAWLDANGAARAPAPIALPTVTGRRASIAAASSGYLVAWETENRTDIRMARVGRDGAVLDAGGRAVTVATAGRKTPVVTSDGTNFLVAWCATIASGSRDAGAYYALYSPAAELIGATATYLGPAGVGDYMSPIAATFDGTQYVVSRGSYVARVSRAGTLLDPSGRSLFMVGETDPIQSTVAGLAPPFLVRGTGFARFAADLTPVGTTAQAATTGYLQFAPRAASDGRDFFVVWQDQSGPYESTGATALGVRVSASGAVLDLPAMELGAPPADPFRVFRPGVVFNGATYLVSGEGLSRVGSDGARVGAPAPVATPRMRLMAASRDAALLGSVFTPAEASNLVLRVRPDGTALDRGPITLTFAVAAAASDGAGFLVLGRDGQGARINADGDVLDSPALRLCASGQCAIAGAGFDGANYLVAWVRDAEPSLPFRGPVQGVRLSRAGAVLDASPLALSPPGSLATAADVTYDGRTFVVAWDDASRGGGDVLATRVDGDGRALDPAAVVVAASPAAETSPSLASNGAGRTLVAYERYDAVLSAKRVMVRVIDLSPDAAAIDAGSAVVDVPATDVGTDAARADAGAVTDLGTITDVGAVADGGAAVDAGRATDVVTPSEDAPLTDVAATSDAGVTVDAGDAMPPADGGGLCSVRPGATGRGGAAWIAAFASAIAVARRRKRRV